MKQVCSFKELFNISKYNEFCLSYELFSTLCDILLPENKQVISSPNSHDFVCFVQMFDSLKPHLVSLGTHLG